MIATVLALGRLCRISNPKRAIIVVHHALTGKAGASKATGWERSGFARNSKALLGWTRAQINVAPALPDDNSQLVIACGKNNDGKEFAPFAIHLNDSTMMYEVLPDFDLDNWRHEITSPGKTGVKPQLLRDLLEPGREYDKKQIVALIKEETGCAKTRAYELVDQAKARSVLRFNKTIKTYVLA